MAGLLAILGSIASCGWIVAYIAYRTVQPYPLDAFEEYQLHKAIRWTQGASLYGAAETEPFPEAYPPLYFCVLGIWTRLFGESFQAARLLSLLAVLGTAAASCWSLRDASHRGVARLAFLTCLLGLHAMTGDWFEIAKPDTLLVLLLAVAIASAGHGTWLEVVVSSLALWLASLTKQNAPLFVLPLCLAHVLSGRWRWAVAWGGCTGLCIAASYWLLDWLSAGGFSHWVFAWPATHGVDASGGLSRAARAVLWRGPILLPILVGSVLFRPRCRWTWCLLTAVVLALLGMSKRGGIENHLLPAACIAATIAGRWTAMLWERAEPLVARRIVLVGMLAVAALPGVPTRRDFRWLSTRAREVAEWTSAVRQLGGRVAVGHHRLLARQAGAECVFSDLILQFPGLDVPAPVREMIASEQFDYLVLGPDPLTSRTSAWGELVSSHYLPLGELDCPDRSGVLPRRLFVPRQRM